MFDPTVTYHKLMEAGGDWADKKSAYQLLEDTTKSVLSDIKGEFRDAGISISDADIKAYRSKRYMDHLVVLSEARKAYLHSAVKWEAIQTLARLRQSEESTRRAEMTMK
jgi:hypothetical protein